ncbi:Txe/YoeB family addiction module toxin [Sutterella massiliensis]|uniref:Txe/YoeB family addiction module toxin n=1 Tax=Sutterella massiliensis TaxID=1816689 RepID=UPI00308459F1
MEDTLRHPTKGLGKPEPLKKDLSSFWSRRINQEHRLVYAFDEESVTIFHVGGMTHDPRGVSNQP